MQWPLLLYIVALSALPVSVLTDTITELTTRLHKNETAAKVRSRFVAANALELEWTIVGDQEKVFDLQSVREIDVDTESSNSSLIFAVLTDGNNCDRSVLGNECYLNRAEVCVFWNLVPTQSYNVCLRSWLPNAINNTLDDMVTPWKTVQMKTEFRQPPTITRCKARILNGESADMDDTARVLEVPYVKMDEITLSCDITGYPSPSIFWCKNRHDCNASNVDAGQMLLDSGTVLTIRNAARHHEGLFYCIAENKHGRTMTSAIHLQFMEISQFPSSDVMIKVTVTLGDRTKLECRYPKDSGKLKFSWSKFESQDDHRPILINHDARVILGWDGSLLFLYTLAQDNGTYQCNVGHQKLDSKRVSGSRSGLEVTSTDAVLFDRVPLLLTKSPDIVSATVGDTVMLQCVFAGKPIPRVLWHWDSPKETDQYDLSDGNVTLTISNIQLMDAKQFRCSAENSEGRSRDYAIQVDVYEAPRFLRRPVSRNITVGQTVKFFCEAAGSPLLQLQWLINGEPIKDGTNLFPWNYSISEDLNVLTIHGVTQLTAFNIQCNISNNYGYKLANAYFNVFLPTKITRSPEDVVLAGQQIVTFSCSVQTDPSTVVAVTWLRGYKEIVYDNQRIYQLANQSLVLNLTNEEDGGNSFIAQYTCIASNGMNKDSRSARLRPSLVHSFKATISEKVTPDMLWLGVICGIICLLIITTTALCILYNHPNRIKAGTADVTDQELENSWRQDNNIKMMRRSKPNPGSRIKRPDNRFHFDLPSVENAEVLIALQQMYIPRERLRLGNCIGRGQFGRVFSAYLCHAREKIEEHVAVKTMKYKPEETEMAELFLREALLMKDFWHAHVLGVIGVTFDPDGSPMVILPFMANGDLRKYIMSTELDITVMQLLKMSLQVAYGMTYLSSMRFVHRDLAARNCMVDERGVVKVADFGLSRELILCDYYRLSNNKTPVPVRWMAPECLEANVFTTMSDVWSFGVLLWELVTRGAVPFSDLENWEVAGYIQSGKRLPQPLYCPDSVYFIMLSCWQEESYNRPTFEQITRDIEQIIRSAQAMSSNGTPSTMVQTSPAYTNTTNTNVPSIDSDYHT